MILFVDTETRSPVPISHGAARYATSSEVLLVAWAVDYGPAKVWDVTSGREMPKELHDALRSADEVWAHNANFDRTVTNGAPLNWDKIIPLSKWRCSMALALAHGLPGALDKLCDVFKVESSRAKLATGRDLIRRFCIPNKDGSFSDRRTHPEEWKQFIAYAKNDIPAMQDVHKKCPKLNYGSGSTASRTEVALWHLDQRVNDRGFAVDVDFAKAAVRATGAEKKRNAAKTEKLTGGAVERATQRDKLLQHLLTEYGVALPDLRADTLTRRLEDPELPEHVKDLLRLRLEASKSSTTKYKALLNMEVGGRLMGTLQYCAANRTMRWGGRNFQPQNLPRPKHSFEDILAGIEDIKAGVEDIFQDDVMGITSSAIRSAIIAPPGHKLVVSDLSNIEGRGLTWLANEEWKLEAFRAFDKDEGYDLYVLAYAKTFNVDPDTVTKAQRQIGKVLELAMGYAGGVGAFVTFAATYSVDLNAMAESAYDTLPKSVLRDAESFWHYCVKHKRTLGLSQRVFVVCDSLKRTWRAAHPNTVTLWSQVETAAKHAVNNSGKVFKAGDKVTCVRKGSWLYVKTPAGRVLCYPEPKVENDSLSYSGVDAYTKKWARISTHGGKLVENIVQHIARCILADAMPRAEASGYELVLTVHDELVCETPDTDEFTAEGLGAILAAGEPWSTGLPLAAAGFETYRYRKDD